MINKTEFTLYLEGFFSKIPQILREEYKRQYTYYYFQYIVTNSDYNALRNWERNILKRIKLQKSLYIWDLITQKADTITDSIDFTNLLKSSYEIITNTTLSNEQKIKQLLSAGWHSEDLAKKVLEIPKEKLREIIADKCEIIGKDRAMLGLFITKISTDKFNVSTHEALITYDFQKEQIRFASLDNLHRGEEELFADLGFVYSLQSQTWEQPLNRKSEEALTTLFGNFKLL